MASGSSKIKVVLQHWEFGLIFLLASILRFWNLHEADFVHDELSALLRTKYHSFADLINLAVRPDGHPALTQIFLYYWAPLVKYHEFWVKLPFVLAGLGSILLIYLALLKVYPKTKTPLVAPAIMAASELFVYHHQIARPYALGALFVSWAIYAYLAWFYQEKSKYQLIQFGVAASLAAYTHYLALLSVLIIGFSALIREREQVKLWWLTGLAVLLVFSPHLGIFFDQLSLGGVGQWLAKPGPLWLLDFFRYTFNFSFGYWSTAFLLIGLLIYGIKSPFKEAWAWFLICFGIAFFYSLLRNPVLQYSSLLFLSPVVFIFPFSKRAKPILVSATSFTILSLLSLSLILNRDYFEEAQLSPAKEVKRFRPKQSNLKVYYHWSKEKWDFYREINQEVLPGEYLETLAPEDLAQEGFILLMDHESPAHWPLALCDYGFEILKSAKHFGFSIYQFGGLHERQSDEYCGFRLMEKKSLSQETNQYQNLGSLASSTYLADLSQSSVVVQFQNLKTGPNCHLVFQILDGDEQVNWFAHPIDSNSNYLSRPIGKYGINQYQWRILIDQGQKPIAMEGEVSVRLVSGNEKIYGLVQDFK